MPISSRVIATRRQARFVKPMVMAPFPPVARSAGSWHRAGDQPETALEGQVRPKPVERDHEEHGRVALTPKDAADRLRDVGWRERGGCRLVEERLEEMVVASVDDGDLNGRVLERSRRGQPAEPGTDDYHPYAEELPE